MLKIEKLRKENDFRLVFKEKTRLLVCLKNGVIIEYDGPDGMRFDTSTTYLIESQLATRIFRFRSIKSRLRVRK